MIKVTDEMIYIRDHEKDVIPIAWKDLKLIRRDIGSGVCFIRKDGTRAYCASPSFPRISEKILKAHPDTLDIPDLYMMIPAHSIGEFNGIGECLILERCQFEDKRLNRMRDEARRKMMETPYGIHYLVSNYYYTDGDKDRAMEGLFRLLRDGPGNGHLISCLSNRLWALKDSGDQTGLWKLLKRIAGLGKDFPYYVLISGFIPANSSAFQEMLDIAMDNPCGCVIDRFSRDNRNGRPYLVLRIRDRPALEYTEYYSNTSRIEFSDEENSRLARKCINGVLRSGGKDTMEEFVSSFLMRNGSGDMTETEIRNVQRKAIGRLIGQGGISAVVKALGWCQVRRDDRSDKWTEKLARRAVDLYERELKNLNRPDQYISGGMLTIWNTLVLNKSYSMSEPRRSDETLRLLRRIFDLAKGDPVDYLYKDMCRSIVLDQTMWQYDDMLVPALEKFRETAYGDTVSDAARNADFNRRIKNSELVMEAAFQAMKKNDDGRLIVRLSKLPSCISDRKRRDYIADKLMKFGEYKHLVEMQKSYLKQL